MPGVTSAPTETDQYDEIRAQLESGVAVPDKDVMEFIQRMNSDVLLETLVSSEQMARCMEQLFEKVENIELPDLIQLFRRDLASTTSERSRGEISGSLRAGEEISDEEAVLMLTMSPELISEEQSRRCLTEFAEGGEGKGGVGGRLLAEILLKNRNSVPSVESSDPEDRFRFTRMAEAKRAHERMCDEWEREIIPQLSEKALNGMKIALEKRWKTYKRSMDSSDDSYYESLGYGRRMRADFHSSGRDGRKRDSLSGNQTRDLLVRAGGALGEDVEEMRREFYVL